MKKSILRSIFLLAAVATIAAGTASANSILVVNGDFQSVSTPLNQNCCGQAGLYYNQGPVPGWTIEGSGGQWVQNGPFQAISASVISDGTVMGWLNAGDMTQTVGATVVSGQSYTLTADLLYRDDSAFDAWAALVIGGNTYYATGTTPAPGGESPFSVTFVGTAATAGDPIEVELGTNGGQGDFASVLLVTPVPEEGALVRLLLCALTLAGALAFARKPALTSLK